MSKEKIVFLVDVYYSSHTSEKKNKKQIVVYAKDEDEAYSKAKKHVEELFSGYITESNIEVLKTIL